MSKILYVTSEANPYAATAKSNVETDPVTGFVLENAVATSTMNDEIVSEASMILSIYRYGWKNLNSDEKRE